MANFNDFTKKLNLGEIVQQIKGMISPSGIPEVPPTDDEILKKIVALNTMIEELGNSYAEQANRLKSINQSLNAIYNDVLAQKKPVEGNPADESPSNPADKSKTE